MLHRPIGRLLAAVFAVALPSAFAADNIAWGDPQHEIRIGIAGSSVFFENTGRIDQTVLVGRTTGIGPIYALHFTATTPEGREIKLLNGGQAGVGGYMGPLPLRLAPGGMQEISIPMSKIFMIEGPGRDRALDAILRLNYSVSVSLEVDQAEVDWATRSNTTFGGQKFWTGAMTSGMWRQPQ